MKEDCKQEEKFLEKEYLLLKKLDNYRHILEVYKKTFDTLLVLSNEKLETVVAEKEILSNIKQEIQQSSEIVDHHYDKNGEMCFESFNGCSVCESMFEIPKKPKIKSTPKKSHLAENIKCNFCSFVASEKDVLLLHIKKFHAEILLT